MSNEYKIHLKPNAKPSACYVPRKTAHPLVPKLKAELDRMEKLGVISKVDQPTEWCSYMVVVPKGNRKVRICLDPLKHYWNIRTLLGTQLSGSKVFTKVF